jgi:hypothetical protein
VNLIDFHERVVALNDAQHAHLSLKRQLKDLIATGNYQGNSGAGRWGKKVPGEIDESSPKLAALDW